MPSKAVVTKQELDASITAEQVQKLIEERKPLGGKCKEKKEGNKRFLVCEWPPLVVE